VTLPGGKKLILTQTGGKPPCHTTTSSDNFYTSETHKNSAKCTKNDRKIAVFHVTVDGRALSYSDTGQVLNTGGKDPGDRRCGFHSEVRAWARIGS